jgi:predicted alpha/beta-hydrolase family hydrolase
MSKRQTTPQAEEVHSVDIPAGEATLDGDLRIPSHARGLVLFVHGSGSSRHSPRNQYVAQVLRAAGLGTLLFDLLTPEEEHIDLRTPYLRFDMDLLVGRLEEVTAWVADTDATRHLRLGYFGASTGGGAALMAAARLGQSIGAVVSRGGRPDLAGALLPKVLAPTLLIVGGRDEVALQRNEAAYAQLQCAKVLHIVPGATHLFEEPGVLDEVARLATEWFQQHLHAARKAT